MGALSTYLEETSDLLHDQKYLFTSRRQLTRHINDARRQLAQHTGCIRRLITGQSAFGASAQPGAAIPGGMQPGALPGALPTAFSNGNASRNSLQAIAGVERYPFRGFWNPYLQSQYAGVEGVIDVIDLAVNWGGSIRPALSWQPWEYLQAYARAYATLVTSYPYYWSVMNDGTEGEVWLFPVPSSVGEMEADVFCTPKALQNEDDFDAIPDGYRNAVKFKAASLAFMAKRQTLESQYFEGQFLDRVGIGNVAKDRGKVPNYYATAF